MQNFIIIGLAFDLIGASLLSMQIFHKPWELSELGNEYRESIGHLDMENVSTKVFDFQKSSVRNSFICGRFGIVLLCLGFLFQLAAAIDSCR
jgi:hypothetical protein